MRWMGRGAAHEAGRRQSRDTLRRVRRNLRWILQGTTVAALMAAGVILWLPIREFVWPLVAVLALVPVLLVRFFATSRETTWAVDAEEVRHLEDGVVVGRIRWADLERVEIVTNDSGPWGEDFWWVLAAPEDVIPIPSERVHNDDQLFSRLLKLDGFDKHRLAEAIGSTTDNRFVVWEGPASVT